MTIQMLDDYLAPLAMDERSIFSTIANFAFSLGYKAKKDKTNTLGYTFTHTRVKKPILRFTRSRNMPIIRFKFFASSAYSQFFHEAIRRTIEEYDFRYTGCYGCGGCDGTRGYRYRYPDGREFYRCGAELIEIENILHIPIGELLELFKAQHDYYLSEPGVTK
jgi:hypothetical protein